MKKYRLFFLLGSLAFRLSFAQSTSPVVSIIPQPASLQTGAGQFALSKQTVMVAGDAQDRKTADYLNDYLQNVYGFTLRIGEAKGSNAIRFTTKKTVNTAGKEAYRLNVTKDGISVEGDTYDATFYAAQTLIQLLPATINNKPPTTNFSIPFVSITDYPRFAYRGMHLDVSRHFFSVAYVKRYIDYLALHKFNYFHWHLTDDQGWRIEIKQYPNLISTGAYRDGTIIGRYPGTGNDNQRYGGYYTQEEVKAVVKYAAERHITVVPEIEMPGHASAAIAAYPWLSCFPGEDTKIPSHPSTPSASTKGKHVQETWGVFEDIFCAGKDSTFTFLQNVLDEVIPLFPSQYVHVGGDEAPKTHWKRCPLCQARMKKEGLKNEHELQSYFIQRMEKYVNAKGKTLVGWDEILEGGLAPNAVVMSWRGEEGGIAAAKEKHKVIMTPTKAVYFDYSQTKAEDSVVIGGYLPVEKVYEYDPIPKELTPDQAKYVLGAQGNLWTEYIAYPSKVEYMVFPRMSALSEVVWSPKETRNWKDFEQRLQTQFKRYALWKANYSKAYFDIKAAILPSDKDNTLKVTLTTNSKEGSLGYLPSTSASNIINYTAPIYVSQQSPYLNAVLFTPGKNAATSMNVLANFRQAFSFNKATGKKVSITKTPNEKYPGQGGAFSLVNGVYSAKGLSYPDWLGFIGDDLEATIDLGKTATMDSVRMHTLEQNGSWIYLPQYVEVFASNDGTAFNSIGKSSNFRNDTLTMGWMNIPVKGASARYLKVFAKNVGLIPDDKPGGGNKAWLFADEIQVY